MQDNIIQTKLHYISRGHLSPTEKENILMEVALILNQQIALIEALTESTLERHGVIGGRPLDT